MASQLLFDLLLMTPQDLSRNALRLIFLIRPGPGAPLSRDLEEALYKCPLNVNVNVLMAYKQDSLSEPHYFYAFLYQYRHSNFMKFCQTLDKYVSNRCAKCCNKVLIGL